MVVRTVPHYKVPGKLGGRGMDIYKAGDIRQRCLPELKFLPVKSLRNSQAFNRFRLEARAASPFNHLKT